MKIYVCCQGERGEGKSPYIAFKTLDKAREHITKAALAHSQAMNWKMEDIEPDRIAVGCDVFCIEGIVLEE